MAGQIIAGGKYATLYTFTNGTSPTVGSSAVYTCQDQISTDVSMDSGTGAWTVTIDNVQDDAALNTFIETYRDYTIANIESLTMEDGTQQLANSSKTLMLIVKGSTVVGGSSAGATKCVSVPCLLDLSAGGYKQEGGKYNRPKLVFKSVPIGGTLTLVTALFSGVMTTATQSTIGTAQKYGRVYFG